MAFGKKGGHKRSGKFLLSVRFCPACGTDSLDRDPDTEKPEFTCSLCGYSFRIVPSIKWQQSARLFNAHKGSRFVDYGRG